MSRTGRALVTAMLTFAVACGLAGTAAPASATDIFPSLETASSSSESSYDYWSQIVQRRIPEVRDGNARYFPWGRYYLGPNGLEVRLNNDGTQWVSGFAIAGGVAIGGPAVAKIAANTTPMVANALSKFAPPAWTTEFVVGQVAGDQVTECIGFTLPSQWVARYLNGSIDNLQAAAGGKVPMGFGYDVPVWFEAC